MIKEKISIMANIIGYNKRDAFGRLLTHPRNRIGPIIDPRGKPQGTYLRPVLLFSPIWTYCFLLEK